MGAGFRSFHQKINPINKETTNETTISTPPWARGWLYPWHVETLERTAPRFVEDIRGEYSRDGSLRSHYIVGTNKYLRRIASEMGVYGQHFNSAGEPVEYVECNPSGEQQEGLPSAPSGQRTHLSSEDYQFIERVQRRAGSSCTTPPDTQSREEPLGGEYTESTLNVSLADVWRMVRQHTD